MLRSYLEDNKQNKIPCPYRHGIFVFVEIVAIPENIREESVMSQNFDAVTMNSCPVACIFQ